MSRAPTSSDNTTPVATSIERSGTIDWSMSTPLTRDAVGMAAGKSEVIYSRPGSDNPFDVVLHLPGGTSIHTEATDILVTARAPEAQPDYLAVIRHGLTADRVQELLTGYVDTLGIDESEIAPWRERSDAVAAGGDGSRTFVFRGRSFDYLGVEVEAETDRDDTRVGITLLFNWSV